MSARHLEILTEEPSMEVFLQGLLPRMLPQKSTFKIHTFRGKPDLLKKLQARLIAYAKWMPDHFRIMVVVDRDSDDCRELKGRLEDMATASSLVTRSRADLGPWQVVNRVAIEELEAWYFGDWEAVCRTYPRVSRNIPNRARYRDPDAIHGGTWEAFENIMKQYGYFKEGLGKVHAAGAIAKHMDPDHNRSNSFARFRDAIIEAASSCRQSGQDPSAGLG